jgi:hypothetical protein
VRLLLLDDRTVKKIGKKMPGEKQKSGRIENIVRAAGRPNPMPGLPDDVE